MVASHVIVGGHDVIHEQSKLNTCGCDAMQWCGTHTR